MQLIFKTEEEFKSSFKLIKQLANPSLEIIVPADAITPDKLAELEMQDLYSVLITKDVKITSLKPYVLLGRCFDRLKINDVVVAEYDHLPDADDLKELVSASKNGWYFDEPSQFKDLILDCQINLNGPHHVFVWHDNIVELNLVVKYKPTTNEIMETLNMLHPPFRMPPLVSDSESE